MSAVVEPKLSWENSAPPKKHLRKKYLKQARPFLKIAELDTSIASQNLGDQIIMDASREMVRSLFPDAFYVSFPTHEFLAWESYRVLKDCDYAFVGGSNLLKSSMLWNNQWKISPLDFLMRRQCILLGCGWWNYQAAPDWYSRLMLRKILSGQHLHSVRDQYTQQQLHAAGIDNVLNTACITMWKLDSAHCGRIPLHPAPQVVTTVTAYNADPEADRETMRILLETYETVWFWPQQMGDIEYAMDISGGMLSIIPPTLASYTDFLRSHHVDYVGSRLHGGIRALQTGKRVAILAVDNRALEIQRDTGLPVMRRTDLQALKQWVSTPAPTLIHLPTAAIEQWQQQFSGEPQALQISQD